MKPVTINFLNGLILIAAGLYGYYGIPGSDGTASITALIPAAFGLLLIIVGLFWKKSPKVVSHIAVVLTLVLLIMVINRFVKVETWEPKKIVFLICAASNAIALFIFIRSFIVARIKK